jgi:hypothetical protein
MRPSRRNSCSRALSKSGVSPASPRFAPIGIAQRTREHRIDAPRLGWRRLLRIEPGAADDPALLEREMLHHLEHVRLARAVVPEHRERAAAFADVEHPLEGVDLAVAPHRVGKQPLHRHDAEPQGFEHLPLFALLVGELRSDGHALLLGRLPSLGLAWLGRGDRSVRLRKSQQPRGHADRESGVLIEEHAQAQPTALHALHGAEPVARMSHAAADAAFALLPRGSHARCRSTRRRPRLRRDRRTWASPARTAVARSNPRRPPARLRAGASRLRQPGRRAGRPRL